MRWLIVLFAALGAVAAGAAEVKIFRIDSQEAVLQGTLDGVSVDPLGAVELSRRLERLTAIDEPFVFSAAAHPRGWVVGTGNSGKVLTVGADGEVAVLLTAEEPEVFAVWAGDDGEVLAGTSPDGKVLSLGGGGGSQVVFDPEGRYIWDLERDGEGRLLVATGLPGRLYRVDAKGAAQVLYESRDSHVRAIAVLPGGDILLGTAGEGLIVRLSPGGEAETLHDAVHPEVVAFATAPTGQAWAAVLASEASFVDLSAGSPPAGGEEKKPAGGGEAEVTVVGQGAATVGSRGAGFSGPRSLVLEISPDGKVEQIVELASETVHSLLWQAGELWIGTGQEGKLYRWRDGSLRLEATLEERQIAGLVAGPAGAAVVTANASALYRLHDELVAEGEVTSSVLDAAQVARFGSFQWQGSLPRGAGVELAFRSGMSESPDATWTSWTAGSEVGCVGCENGRVEDFALGALAHGRYVQWRARLRRGPGGGPRLKSAELTYRQENLEPRIKTLEVLDPGQILVPASFNPQSQTFEPWSPNREGIFTSLRLETPKNGSGGLKNLWKKGYRTLRWSAEDDNEDELVYRLDFRPEEEAEAWLLMVEEIDETHYGFDSTVLPDGVYRFRLRANDGKGRPAGEALFAEKLSAAVVVDHSPPELVAAARRGSAVEVELRDALSPMRDAAVSFDASQWRPALPADGLLDGRRERLTVEVPADARLVLLRVSDAAHNVITFDLSKASSRL